MEQEKINIAELLKNCPKGMELDCVMFNNVTLLEVEEGAQFPISIKVGIDDTYLLTEYGEWNDGDINAKCVIFPKGKTTWEGFISPCKFKGGDVLISEAGNTVLFSHIDSQNHVHYHCIISIHGSSLRIEKNTSTGVGEYYKCTLANEHQKQRMYDKIKGAGYKYNQNTNKLEKLLEFKDGDIVCTILDSIAIIKEEYGAYYTVYCGVMEHNVLYFQTTVTPMRLATEEEKQKLFDAIKDNGYRWNAETKTLEKLIVPKFKVGDKVKEIKGNRKGTIINISGNSFYEINRTEGFSHVNIADQDEWELVPDKFDITTLKPYKSEVLCRNSAGGYWKPAFWGKYIPENSEQHSNHNFLTTEGFVHYCIPFEGNEHLMGTQTDCSEYYKTWEEWL